METGIAIREVVRNKHGDKMKGVVALRPIRAYTYLCSYGGKTWSCSSLGKKLSKLSPAQIQLLTSYDMIHPVLENHIISPMNFKTGELLPEYQNNPAFYFNEASEPGEYPNVCFALNLAKDRLDLVTIRDIREGEELLTYYGSNDADRGYRIHWLHQQQNGGEHKQQDEVNEYKSRLILQGNRMYVLPISSTSKEVIVHNLSFGGKETLSVGQFFQFQQQLME